jgi:hypothetical protein
MRRAWRLRFREADEGDQEIKAVLGDGGVERRFHAGMCVSTEATLQKLEGGRAGAAAMCRRDAEAERKRGVAAERKD